MEQFIERAHASNWITVVLPCQVNRDDYVEPILDVAAGLYAANVYFQIDYVVNGQPVEGTAWGGDGDTQKVKLTRERVVEPLQGAPVCE